MTLSQRTATAQPDETRALLEEAYNAIHGKSCDWFRYYGEIDQKHDARAFDNMLNAEAYLDAAMMLLPEEWTGLIPVRGGQYEDAWLWPENGSMVRGYKAAAATPALALLSAICMARGL